MVFSCVFVCSAVGFFPPWFEQQLPFPCLIGTEFGKRGWFEPGGNFVNIPAILCLLSAVHPKEFGFHGQDRNKNGINAVDN